MPTYTHTRSGARFRVVLSFAAVSAVALLSSLLLPTNLASAAVSGYNWPVKPFDRSHPVRANFGDPRTTFDGPPTPRSLMSSNGIFALHFGIDIATPDGTAVYPVRSGVASLVGRRTVSVDSGNGFVAQYWHIVPTVTPGQKVEAHKTVLGRVMKGYEHVHFTEIDHGRIVNPLAPGHLAPYDDNTPPRVSAISFREADTGPEILPEFVHGRVVLIAQAYDMPAMAVPGVWNNLPVAPALLTWRIESAKNDKVVLPEQTGFDVRLTLPRDDFWLYYARGTRQNMSTFSGQRAWREPGVYLYKLGRRPFDSARLPNGIYTLRVTATDIRGNRSSTGQVFIVRNRQGL
jgi:murein DD-endopeptidase MepM/ murein hydrolase activator NlpD